MVPLDGYGYVVPRIEATDVLACTWTSQKWDGRAPDGTVLTRVYLGRFGRRDVTLEADEELVALALDELALLDVTATPMLIRVTGGHSACRSTCSATPSASPGSSGADGPPGARSRGRRVPWRGDPRLHPLGRAGCRGRRPRAGRRPRVSHETSERLFVQALDLLPGGVNSPVRAFRAVGGTPLFIERGEGAYLVDVDGNRYIDYVLSWGPLILGHAIRVSSPRSRRRCARARASARRARSRSTSRG